MRSRATMFASLGLTAVSVIGLASASAQEPAAPQQPGLAEQIGQAIDNAGRQVQTETQDVTQTFQNARQQVQSEAQGVTQAFDNARQKVQSETQGVTQSIENARQKARAQAQGVTQSIENARQQVQTEARNATQAVRQGYEQMAADVQRMGAVPRVYARLHWDKTLYNSRIQVHLLQGGTVLLRGVVPSEAARKRAEELAASTVAVPQVVNELTVVPPSAAPAQPASAARPAPALRR